MLYDFTATKDDQLDLVKGDIIILSKTSDEGWWRGFRMRDTIKGWFPASYVVKVQEDEEDDRFPAVEEETWDGGSGEPEASGKNKNHQFFSLLRIA